jgi:pilus assembly protein CpaB
MKPKTLILMVVAVTCGLGASYMTSRLLAQRGQETEEKIEVYVATKNLDQGRTIKVPDEDFEKKEFLAGTEPKDAIKSLDQLKGRQLKRSLRKGDWVQPSDLLSESEVGIAYMMAQGYRGIGVRINSASAAGGFASLPLSRVDVISTVRRGSDRESFAQVLLEDVLVLAIDQNLSRDPEGRAMPGAVATLALKPEDVLKIELAKEFGPLTLALRKFNDKGKTDTDRFTVEQMMTKTGPKDDVAEEFINGQPPVASAPSIAAPKVPKGVPVKAADVVVTDDPAHKKFVLHIIEGETHRTADYFFDSKGELIPREAARVDPSAPPLPAPVLSPPRPVDAVTLPPKS